MNRAKFPPGENSSRSLSKSLISSYDQFTSNSATTTVVSMTRHLVDLLNPSSAELKSLRTRDQIIAPWAAKTASMGTRPDGSEALP